MEMFILTSVDFASAQLNFLQSPRVRLHRRLKDKLQRFKQVVADIRSAFVDVSLEREQGDERSLSVVRLISRALHDAEDILDILGTEAFNRRVFKASLLEKVCICFSATHQMEVARLIHIGEKISALSRNVKGRPLVREPSRYPVDESGGLVIGRDNDKEKIIDFLLFSNNDSNLSNDSVLPIVGIGGIGKTTLALFVFTDERVSDHFEIRKWVTVSSQDFDVEDIARKILQPTHDDGTTPEIDDKDHRIQLRQVIEGKRFLLVLDDIWYLTSSGWSELHELLNVGAHGSKILVTSHDMKVAKITNAPSVHVLEGLSEQDSLSLLMKLVASKEENDWKNNSIRSDSIIDEGILFKFAGVPLAIITAGRNFWTPRAEHAVISVMMPSYDALPLPLKQCVALCSLFPRDYVLNVYELINLWNAHWVDDLGRTPQQVGQEYVRDLVSLFIFQDLVIDECQNIVGCRIHPLFHDLARFVTKGCCTFVDSSYQLMHEGDGPLYVSINMEQGHLEVLQSVKNARVLIFLNKRCHIGEPVVEYIFTNMKKLRSLCLRSLSVSAVSNLLGTLRHLRHLDLSESVRLEALPVPIGELHYLETLILENCCSLKELPRSITKLFCLKELDLSGCSSLTLLPSGIVRLRKLWKLDLSGCSSLTHLPSGITKLFCLKELDLSGCSSLTHLPSDIWRFKDQLQTLGCFVVGEQEAGNVAATLRELRMLKRLKGQLEIKHLHRMTMNSVGELDMFIVIKMSELQLLKLCWDSTGVIFHGEGRATADLLLELLRPHPNLKGISVEGYCGHDADALSKRLSHLTNLVKIDIGDSDWCTSLPPLHSLPYLKSVKLREMRELVYFGTLESSHDIIEGGDFFPALEVLSLRYLNKLKGWHRSCGAEVETEEGEDLAFPTLSAEIHLDVDHTPSFSYAHGRDYLTLSTMKDRVLRRWVGNNIIGKLASSESVLSLPRVRVNPFTSLYSISLAQLKSLKIQDMGDIKSLPDEFFQQLSSLQHLEISHGRFMTTLSGTMILQHLTALETLKIVDFPELDFSKLENDTTKLKGRRSKLRQVRISAVPKMESFPWWFQHLLTELEELVISDCLGLRTLQDDLISKFTSLRSFEIHGCKGLECISKGVILHLIATLESLKICGCPELDLTAEPAEDIIITSQSQHPIRQLHIQQNHRVEHLPWWIEHLGNLEILGIRFCKNLEALPEWFPKLASLQQLHIEYCGKLSEWCTVNRVHLINLPKISDVEVVRQLCIPEAAAEQKRKSKNMSVAKEVTVFPFLS